MHTARCSCAQVVAYFKGQGASVVVNPDQDCHDLDKCLDYVRRQQEASGTKVRHMHSLTHPRASAPPRLTCVLVWWWCARSRRQYRVFVYGGFGGRADHVMSNLAVLYRWCVTAGWLHACV